MIINQLNKAKMICRESGEEALMNFLEKNSYGYGDKFCAMDLIEIQKSFKYLKIKKDYMLWEKVKKFINVWDFTLPVP